MGQHLIDLSQLRQTKILCTPLRLYAPFFLPAPSHLPLRGILRIVRYGHEFLARIVATRAFTWVRPNLIDDGAKVLARGRHFAVDWADKYVSFYSHFGAADVL